MTDRRDLVARAINPTIWHEPGDSIERDEILPFLRKKAYGQADAVLAVLEPWLLPELPEWAMHIEASRWSDGGWAAYVAPNELMGGRDGRDATPAAAIRAAMEGSEYEEDHGDA